MSTDNCSGAISKRKDYAWNTAAGVINAAEVILMSMIVMRFGKLSDAGVLSFAFAVANVLMSIGAFGGRMFQATDVNRQYTFKMYLIHRFCSLGLMIVSLVLYLSISGFESEKAWSVALLAYIYMIEVVENCIWGYFQSKDMLYIGARMFCSRWAAVIATFTVSMMILNDMIKALGAGAIAGTIVFVTWIIVIVYRRLINDSCHSVIGAGSPGTRWFVSLTAGTFPLFAAGFCSLFINNVPKFAIDRYLNDEIQACYGFVAMPVFVIGLLNQFIYQPTVARLAREYTDGKISAFRENVKHQMFEVAGIMVACVVGAGAFGIPVLSFIYNTDLTGYWKELVILQLAGGFLALSGYFNVILTIMRKQNVILRGYLFALVLGTVIMYTAVRYAGTVGASVGYLIVMAALFAYYYVFYYLYVRGIGKPCEE